jgi:DNA-binding GntR family transcriptional regulator
MDLEGLVKRHMAQAKSVESVVVDILRQAVLAGMFRPGEVMRQDRLARSLGVSRMPVREALRRLEVEGLVRHLPRRGFVTATLTARDVTEIFQLRALLEGYAMRMAVPRLDEGRLRRLEALHTLMHRREGVVDAMEAFYRTLYEAADRPRLLRAIMQLRAEVARWLPAKRTPIHSHSHDHLLALCRRRDGRGAQQFIRTHLEHVGHTLQQHVQAEHDGEPIRHHPGH